MNISGHQSQALLMAATGMTHVEIADKLGIKKAAVIRALVQARKRTLAAGLRVICHKPEPAFTSESGFSVLKRLAAEAGLKKGVQA